MKSMYFRIRTSTIGHIVTKGLNCHIKNKIVEAGERCLFCFPSNSAHPLLVKKIVKKMKMEQMKRRSERLYIYRASNRYCHQPVTPGKV